MTQERALRILVVEDDLVDQMAVRRVVRDAGLPYTLTMAASVEEACAALASFTFDVVVTDYALGDGTALDVLAAAGDLASIIVTGAGDQEKATSGLKAGAADYLVKTPQHGHLAALPAAIDRALRMKAQDRRVQMLGHALRYIGEAVFVTAEDDRIVFVNRAFCEMYGWSEEEVIGRTPVSLWPASTYRPAALVDERVNDVAVQTKDGSFLSVALTRSPVHDDAGKVIAMVRVMRDMTERNRIERELREANVALERSRAAMQELATRDELTGLYNRRELVHRLTAELDRASRTGRPLSFVLLDVDHFKSINDRFGHPAGDAVLRQLACIVGAEVRTTDTAARYGGEEIALVFPETDVEQAVAIAERLRACIAAEPFDVDAAPDLVVTASFGVACLDPDTTCFEALLAAADEALYEAKASGRNRIAFRCALASRKAA